ncbi:Zn-dependent exopeptidase [Microstroma glucosiphilum]|uniref:Peptide hydrolase n=1 Tax=Pseudomicrostroma glucosiphilum TaxID=1684307 RepID=A0A316UCP3_9BASI|nr:Zn-dependent exopeptidase [Pseudomicrostroma glucosiphilum]PWN20805.1 Zn-dependent exopeptidase [Pseudomicrostroma glucosiphilum]
MLAALSAQAALLHTSSGQRLWVQTTQPGQSTGLSHAEGVIATVPHYDGTAVLRIDDSDTASSLHWREVLLPAGIRQEGESHLLWVTREVVDAALEAQEDAGAQGGSWEEHLKWSLAGTERTASQLLHSPHVAQHVFSPPAKSSIDIIAIFGSSSALLSVPPSRLSTLDLHLPRFTQAFLITPETQLPTRTQGKDEPKFPTPSLLASTSKWLRSHHLSVASLNKTATTLSGEDQSLISFEQRWPSRHSATYGCRLASQWILAQMREALGQVQGARCELEVYGEGNFSPNVVCVIPGQDEGVDEDADYQEGAILLSAHYDSRGSFGNPRAPGGNDDGSGSTMLLAISRILGEKIAADQASLRSRAQGKLPSGLRRRELQLVFFSGEEQGLVGSKHYATALAAALREGSKVYSPAASTLYRSTTLRLALQTDMIGFQSPSEPVQLAFPDKLATTSATHYIWATAQLYVPELLVGFTPACCSDHQSFWEAGYPATWVFERNGPILDDKYHNSGDMVLREGYSVEKIGLVGKVVLASALGLL